MSGWVGVMESGHANPWAREAAQGPTMIDGCANISEKKVDRTIFIDKRGVHIKG